MELTPPDPRIGVVLQGRYEILERIASGAMGVVYRGQRVTLGRTVAVKFLHPWIAAQQAFRTRFETEARAMSRLAHPNCVSVIDFGLEGSSPYLVMDFVTGATLRQLMLRGPMVPSRSVGIARQVLAGIAHAHSQSIIHRDLKPENLILCETVGLGDHVRILDFGLAKLRDGPALTSGLALGTPSYMSPEQTGASGEIDGRTDLYAVGIVLFEMLAGRKPFVSEKVAEILLMHRDARPPSLRQLVPELGISVELEAVVQRALAKSPDARFQSATEFALALDLVPEAAVQFRGAAASSLEPVSPPGPVQIGPSLLNPIDETIAESSSPLLPPAGRPPPGTPKAPDPPPPSSVAGVLLVPSPSRPQVGPRLWIGLSALLCLALVLVFLGLRGAPGPASRQPVAATTPPVTPSSAATTPAGHEREARPDDTDSPPIRPIHPIHPSSMPAAGDLAAGHGDAAPRPAPTYPASVAASGTKPIGAVSLGDRLRNADALSTAGEWEQAKVVLEKAHRENPGSAEPEYRLANLALEHKRWGEGAEAARTAAAREPRFRSDERLVKNLIRSLVSDKGYERSESVLQGFGPPAVPLLKDAAARDPSPVVRQRAREILQSGSAVSRSRGPVIHRSTAPPRTSERSFFSR